jgi:hypothetical protein
MKTKQAIFLAIFFAVIVAGMAAFASIRSHQARAAEEKARQAALLQRQEIQRRAAEQPK